MENLLTAERQFWEQAASLGHVAVLRGQRPVPDPGHLGFVHHQSADHGQSRQDTPSNEHQVQVQGCRKEGPGQKVDPKHSRVDADLCSSYLGSLLAPANLGSLLTLANEGDPGK